MESSGFSKRYFFKHFIKNRNVSQSQIIKEIEMFAEKNNVFQPNNAKWFVFHATKFWNKCNRTESRFESHFSNFLNDNLYEANAHTNDWSTGNSLKRKAFDDLSESQKRRRTSELRKEDSSTLLFAASYVLKKEGHYAAAKVIEIMLENMDIAAEILNIYNKCSKIPREKSSEAALAIASDCNLSKKGYTNLRLDSKKQDFNRFPSYEKLLEAKKECYPDNIIVEENVATVKLQSLVDHTVTRLMKTIDCLENEKLIMYYKWGSGHEACKQVFETSSFSDASVFITTLVPVRLVDTNNFSTVWENKVPSSTRFLFTSDPYITSLRTSASIADIKKDLPEEVKALLKH